MVGARSLWILLLVSFVGGSGCFEPEPSLEVDATTGYGLRFADEPLEPVVAEFEKRFALVDDAVGRLPPPAGDAAYDRIDVTEWLPEGVPLDVRMWASDENGQRLVVLLDIDRSQVYQTDREAQTYRIVRAPGQTVSMGVYEHRLVAPPRDSGYSAGLEVVPQVDRLVPRVPVEVTLDAEPTLSLNATEGTGSVRIWGPDDRLVFEGQIDGDRSITLAGAPEGRYVLAATGEGPVQVTGLAAPEVRALPLLGAAGVPRPFTNAQTVWTEELERAPLGVAVGMWLPVLHVFPEWSVEHGGQRVAESATGSIQGHVGTGRSDPWVGWTDGLGEGTYTFRASTTLGHGEAWSYVTYYDRG